MLHFHTSDSVLVSDQVSDQVSDSKEYCLLNTGSTRSYQRCQILCKQSFLAKAMTPNMVKSCHLLARYHNMMLWPDTLTVEGIAAETQVLDVAVGLKKSSTSCNTGVQNINLGDCLLDNCCLVDDRISADLKVLPHYRKNLLTNMVPSLEQA